MPAAKPGFLPGDLYRQVLENTAVATVDVVLVTPEGGLLLGLRRNKPLLGAWYFPGGRVFKGETGPAAAVRKIREELGIAIDPARLRPLATYDDFYPDSAFGTDCHCVTRTYWYRLSAAETDQARAADAQHEDWRTFSPDDPLLLADVALRVRDLRSAAALA